MKFNEIKFELNCFYLNKDGVHFKCVALSNDIPVLMKFNPEKNELISYVSNSCLSVQELEKFNKIPESWMYAEEAWMRYV